MSVLLKSSWIPQISTVKYYPSILPTSSGQRFQSVVRFPVCSLTKELPFGIKRREVRWKLNYEEGKTARSCPCWMLSTSSCFIRTGQNFQIKKRAKNTAEGFSRWATYFHLTPDWVLARSSSPQGDGMLRVPRTSTEPRAD